MSIFFYRETRLRVSDEGLFADTYGKVAVPWQDLESARFVSEVGSSQWAPRTKIGGVGGFGDWRTGWFLLSNGEKAFVTMQTPSRALVLRAKGITYVFAPSEFGPSWKRRANT